MKHLLITCLLFIAINPVFGQSVTVDATGEIQVPADLVVFQININVTGNTPAEVFEEHKNQERYLANLIRERGIDTDRLQFQPMNIGSFRAREGQEYRSNQSVRLTLEDFGLFEEMQVLLIENGFENFSGRFSSTKMSEAEDQALELAIENAQNKASLIARSLNKSLGDVKSVQHGAAPVTRGVEMEAVMRMDAGSMMEFDQKVRVRSSVNITFILE